MTGVPVIIREPDPQAVASSAAAHFAATVTAALSERGAAHVALAGGTTPAATYRLLALTSWEGIELWFGDERCVEPTDPESNYHMACADLLRHAPGAVVHRIEGELGAQAAADAYEARLHARFGGETPVLDLILLGIGEDGHTASLFPDNAALGIEDRACVAVHDAPKPPPDRVSLSLPVLRAARSCVLLATGNGKAAALAGALGTPSTHVPSSLLARERLTVIADTAALPLP
ncbi:MAG: 6-phosphogluconolactonase [Solirubrobacteraceae bacterium]|jgi:6-phosphogluconolactonase